MSVVKTRPNAWLNDFARNVNSQVGEDGIIEKVLEVIRDTDGWCVEFGAWDGMYLSNTYNLVKTRNYSAVYIESKLERFQELQENFKDNPRVVPLNAYVGFDEQSSLDVLLKPTDIPVDFDLLSIDIDGNDYHVWDAIKHYQPKVVVIEYNPTIPTQVEFVQPRDMELSQGNSLLSIVKLGKQKGYELVAATPLNAVLVRSKYFGLFGIEDNSVEAIRTDNSKVAYIFHGYDGTVFLEGYQHLVWHQMPFNVSRMQQVPKWLRQYPRNYGSLKRKVASVYRSLRLRKII